MKNIVLVGVAFLSLASCKTKKTADNNDLPKDISLKPAHHLDQQDDQQELTSLIREIEALIALEPCTDPAKIKFSPIGAKPCGGPSSYIAYSANLEAQILPKIEHFTKKQAAFNKKHNLMSDCAMVMPPAEVRCVDGKAVLYSGTAGSATAE